MKRIRVIAAIALVVMLAGCVRYNVPGPPEIVVPFVPIPPPNEPPIISWTAVHDPAVHSMYEWLFRSDAHDDGTIVEEEWIINGEVLEGSVVVYQFPQAGLFSVRLTATDDDGATESLEIMFSAGSRR